MDHTCQEHVPGSMPRARRRRGREGRANPPWQDAPGHRMLRFHGDGLLPTAPSPAGDPSQHPRAGQASHRDLPLLWGVPLPSEPQEWGSAPCSRSCPSHRVTIRCHRHVQPWRRSSSCFPHRPEPKSQLPGTVRIPAPPPYLPPSPGAPGNSLNPLFKVFWQRKAPCKSAQKPEGKQSLPSQGWTCPALFPGRDRHPEPQSSSWSPPKQPLARAAWGSGAHLACRVSSCAGGGRLVLQQSQPIIPSQ